MCVSPASPCFVTPTPQREEAAATHRRLLLHNEGDHLTLINIYNAYIQRETIYYTHTLIDLHT